MKRNNDFNEISDGRRYKANDMVKADCGGCKDCSDCCKMVDTILLDPYDIYELGKCLNKDFEQMLSDGNIELNVCEGMILPNLKRDSSTGKCNLLNEKGWCSVHKSRPGFCRLFPLGRIYDVGADTFSYFIQVHECPYPNKTKIKVKQWLEIENLAVYEQYISKWHRVQKNMTAQTDVADEDTAKKINYGFLKLFFLSPYDYEKSFYEQFEERLKMIV